MPGCCSYGDTANRKFDAKRASGDLKSFRDKGPNPSTRLLRDGLAAAGALSGSLLGGSLLDIGAGVGALTFELLRLGIAQATVVEASTAFLDASSEEAKRRGVAGAIQFVQGDFLEVAGGLPSALAVTMDRVVCCYPDYEPLLKEAVRHSQEFFAYSYPTDVWYVHALFAVENAARRWESNPFRAFLHPPERMSRIIESAGFRRVSRRKTWMWSVDVYRL